MHQAGYESKLESVLRSASMKDKTVIITTLNDAWAKPGSIFDLFLESFRLGNQTKKFLNHLVVITLDQKAHARCLALHKHCYQLETKGDNFTGEAFFMTADYLQMMWRRIEFLGTVLDMGYNFVFTDTDVMWLRDPFKLFYKDVDFQIACDFFNGNSHDLNNFPNGGFNYVKSNKRTILFYKFWFNSRNVFPKLHDQDVLNKIKKDSFVSNMKLKIRFLSTSYFGGFCQHAEDFNKVSTMHANCCFGLDNKVNDLKNLLDDWKKYVALPENEKNQSHPSWSHKFYKDVDFQIACDVFNGNSSYLNNFPDGGFKYVKSNNRTIWFYKFWFYSRNDYPGHHEQSVLNNIKMHPLVSRMKLKMRLLSTSYFGGFRQLAEDFNRVSTMHANCCVGLENKVNDLKILLEDWKKYMAMSENEKKHSHPSWSVPQLCRLCK
ncbi:hypothetical protein JHK86_046014 [Glycine max]|uniref:Nucleotide-diphospho-sugar transferase domain-containing protein n=1 Tax=Glycine max TaxID=3847 RepID=A0A0R0G2E9_SOYBN|nr:hypothetical protein JHK86_046014 [Glycine max]